MFKNPKHVTRLLNTQNKNLANLISQASRLAQIKIIVNQSLDYDISDHFMVSTLKNQKLTIVADSPAWATRLRYVQNKILERFKHYSFTQDIRSISVKVRPIEFSSNKPPPISRKVFLSAASASIMREHIEAISDPNLQSSLMRVIQHAKKTK